MHFLFRRLGECTFWAQEWKGYWVKPNWDFGMLIPQFAHPSPSNNHHAFEHVGKRARNSAHQCLHFFNHSAQACFFKHISIHEFTWWSLHTNILCHSFCIASHANYTIKYVSSEVSFKFSFPTHNGTLDSMTSASKILGHVLISVNLFLVSTYNPIILKPGTFMK